MIALILLCAAPVWAGELNVGGLIAQGQNGFRTGMGWQVDYSRAIGTSDWSWFAGVSQTTWNLQESGWSYERSCFSMSFVQEGSMTDLRPFVGARWSRPLPWGIRGQACVDVGWDFMDSDLSDTFMMQTCKHVSTYTNDYDMADTWTVRPGLRLTKMLAEKVGVTLDAAYTFDMDPDDITLDGRSVGIERDLSGWRLGAGLVIKL